MKGSLRTLLICLGIALIVLGAEAYYLLSWSLQIGRTVVTTAERTASANRRKEVCDALDRSKDVLATVHTRYADSTVPAPPPAPVSLVPGTVSTPRPVEVPPPVQMSVLTNGAFVLAPEVTPGGRAWQARGSLEWHRALPIVAAFESAYPLAVVEEFAASNTGGPFAMQAIALDVKMRVRFPTRPAGAGAPVKK